MKKALLSILILSFVFILPYAVDENVKSAIEQQIGYGRIDWEKGLVISTGYGAYNLNDKNVGRGRLMALRAAELDAKRNLVETIEGVRINSQTLVKNYQTQSDVIYSEVQGFLRGARRYGEERYNSDGTVEVDVAVPLYGPNGLITILAPQLGLGDVTVPDVKNPVYTGLIVVIKDKNARPMMAPTIVDENGDKIYDASFVNKKFALKMGIVGYGTDLDQAKKNDRVTDNPLIVTAKKVDGDNIVISNEDANKIRKYKDKLTFIQQCRVMLILQ